MNALVLPGNHRSGNVFDPVDITPKNILRRDRTRWISTMFQNHQLAPQMTTISVLLTRKQDLLSRLEESPGPNERQEIENLLEKVDAELNAVDRPDRL